MMSLCDVSETNDHHFAAAVLGTILQVKQICMEKKNVQLDDRLRQGSLAELDVLRGKT